MLASKMEVDDRSEKPEGKQWQMLNYNTITWRCCRLEWH